MKKLNKKEIPSNLKTSSQNISDVGRTSQGAPQKLTPREAKFIKEAKTRQIKKKSYRLKEAMKSLDSR